MLLLVVLLVLQAVNEQGKDVEERSVSGLYETGGMLLIALSLSKFFIVLGTENKIMVNIVSSAELMTYASIGLLILTGLYITSKSRINSVLYRFLVLMTFILKVFSSDFVLGKELGLIMLNLQATGDTQGTIASLIDYTIGLALPIALIVAVVHVLIRKGIEIPIYRVHLGFIVIVIGLMSYVI